MCVFVSLWVCVWETEWRKSQLVLLLSVVPVGRSPGSTGYWRSPCLREDTGSAASQHHSSTFHLIVLVSYRQRCGSKFMCLLRETKLGVLMVPTSRKYTEEAAATVIILWNSAEDFWIVTIMDVTASSILLLCCDDKSALMSSWTYNRFAKSIFFSAAEEQGGSN